MNNWIVCSGAGYVYANHQKEKFKTNFPKDSVGLLQETYDKRHSVVWLIGMNTTWIIENFDFYSIDVLTTGDKFDHKICNVAIV